MDVLSATLSGNKTEDDTTATTPQPPATTTSTTDIAPYDHPAPIKLTRAIADTIHAHIRDSFGHATPEQLPYNSNMVTQYERYLHARLRHEAPLLAPYFAQITGSAPPDHNIPTQELRDRINIARAQALERAKVRNTTNN